MHCCYDSHDVPCRIGTWHDCGMFLCESLEDLHLAPWNNLKSCVFIFRLEVCSEHVLEHVRFPEVLTGPDESDLALSEVRCIVSSERVLGFRPVDLSEHARLLRDAWTDYQVTCGFLPPHLQAANVHTLQTTSSATVSLGDGGRRRGWCVA